MIECVEFEMSKKKRRKEQISTMEKPEGVYVLLLPNQYFVVGRDHLFDSTVHQRCFEDIPT